MWQPTNKIKKKCLNSKWWQWFLMLMAITYKRGPTFYYYLIIDWFLHEKLCGKLFFHIYPTEMSKIKWKKNLENSNKVRETAMYVVWNIKNIYMWKKEFRDQQQQTIYIILFYAYLENNWRKNFFFFDDNDAKKIFFSFPVKFSTNLTFVLTFEHDDDSCNEWMFCKKKTFFYE